MDLSNEMCDKFLQIIESNERAFNEVFAFDKVEDYNKGPFHKFPISVKLYERMNKLMNRKRIFPSRVKDTSEILNLLDYVYESYCSSMNYITNIFADSLCEAQIFSNGEGNLEVYHNENAGIEIQLNYFITVNQATIEYIVDKYNNIPTNNDNNDDKIDNNNTTNITESGYISSIWNYFVR